MRIGAEWLLEKYGTPLDVAEALIRGRLDSSEQEFVSDLVSKVILDAARVRVELGLAKGEGGGT